MDCLQQGHVKIIAQFLITETVLLSYADLHASLGLDTSLQALVWMNAQALTLVILTLINVSYYVLIRITVRQLVL